MTVAQMLYTQVQQPRFVDQHMLCSCSNQFYLIACLSQVASPSCVGDTTGESHITTDL